MGSDPNARVIEVGRLAVEVGTDVWRARYPVRGVSPFSVAPDVALSEVTKGQDIVIGADEVFDRLFVVQSQDPVLMRRMWTTEACHALRAMRSPRVDGTLEDITVRASGLDGQPAPVEHGLRLLEALDRTDPLGLALLEDWTYGSYAAPAGSVADRTEPLLSVPGPVELVVQPIYVRGAAVTSIRARGYCQGIVEGVDLRHQRAEKLGIPAGLHQRVGAARFQHHDGMLYLLWYQIVRDAPVLEAGISLMRALLRGPSFGPYR